MLELLTGVQSPLVFFCSSCCMSLSGQVQILSSTTCLPSTSPLLDSRVNTRQMGRRPMPPMQEPRHMNW